jgi:hypothetical protein
VRAPTPSVRSSALFIILSDFPWGCYVGMGESYPLNPPKSSARSNIPMLPKG